MKQGFNNLILCCFCLLFSFMNAIGNENGGDKNSLLSFYTTNQGKEKLLSFIFSKTQQITQDIKKISSDLEKLPPIVLGSKDYKLCKDLIDQYNRGGASFAVTQLWESCPGLPDGCFENKKLYPSLAGAVFGDWILGMTNSYVPRPLTAEISQISLEKIDFNSPVIKCEGDSCSVKLAIKNFQLKTHLLVKELMFQNSIVLDIPDLKLLIQELNGIGPQLNLVFKLLPNGAGQSFFIFDKEKSFLKIPKGSVQFVFEGNHLSVLSLIKRSGVITAKDATMRTLATGARKFLNLGDWNDFLNLDLKINQFLDKDENIRSVNSLLFPYIDKLMTQILLKNPFFSGKKQEVKLKNSVFFLSSKLDSGINLKGDKFHQLNVWVENNHLHSNQIDIPFLTKNLKEDSFAALFLNIEIFNSLIRELYQQNSLDIVVNQEGFKKFQLDADVMMHLKEVKANFLKPPQIFFNLLSKSYSVDINAQYMINDKRYILDRTIHFYLKAHEKIDYRWENREARESSIYDDEVVKILKNYLMKIVPGIDGIISNLLNSEKSTLLNSEEITPDLEISNILSNEQFIELYF